MWHVANWQWEEGDDWGTDVWVDYDEECQHLLEEARKAQRELIDLDVGYFKDKPGYIANLAAGFQASQLTGMTRRIRRLEEIKREANPFAMNRLKQAFTSKDLMAMVSDPSASQPVQDQPAKLSDADLIAVFEQHVPNLRKLRDWSGTQEILPFLCGTYRSGLPKFKQQEDLNNVLIQAFRHIVHGAQEGNAVAIKCMRPLAEAFESCQAEQGREINRLYGVLTGREKGLPEQLAKFITEYKERLLRSLIPQLFETTEDNDYPHMQVPHIFNRCVVDVGQALGIPGRELALVDVAKPGELAEDKKQMIASRFRQLFDVRQLVDDLVSDINQSGNVERAIERDALTTHDFPDGFDKHMLLHQDDMPHLYNGQEPDEGDPLNIYLVFPGIVAEMLCCFFLKDA